MAEVDITAGIERINKEFTEDGYVVEQVVFYDSDGKEIQASALDTEGEDMPDEQVATLLHGAAPEGTFWTMIVRAPGNWGDSRALFAAGETVNQIDLSEHGVKVVPLLDGVPQVIQEQIREEAIADDKSEEIEIKIDMSKVPKPDKIMTPEEIFRQQRKK